MTLEDVTQTTAEQAIEKRYGAAAQLGSPEVPVRWNDTIDLLARHRSVRRFLDEPVDAATLNSLVLAAQSGATSSNLQVISVIAVRDPDTIRAIAEVSTQSHVERAPLVLIWLVDHSRFQHLVGEGEHVGFDDYLNSFLAGVFDAGIAAQNAVVAAESLGLGTVYLGSVRNNVARIAELLELPDHVFPAVGLSVGWPDPAERADVKPRLPLPAVLHLERFSDTGVEQHLAEHEQAAAAYYAQYGLEESWTQRVRDRVTDSTPERNRAAVSQWLREHGFGLK